MFNDTYLLLAPVIMLCIVGFVYMDKDFNQKYYVMLVFFCFAIGLILPLVSQTDIAKWAGHACVLIGGVLSAFRFYVTLKFANKSIESSKDKK